MLLNPKVGTTTFRRVLTDGLIANGAKPALGRLWPTTEVRRYTTPTAQDFLSVIFRQEEYSFRCFVRNPYARVFSAWKDKLSRGHDQREYPRSMRRIVPQIRDFARRNNLPGCAAETKIPFSTFVHYIEAGTEGYRNQHWDTQRSVLFTDVIAFDRVYKMETEFVPGMTEILTLIGLPRAWVKSNLARPRNASAAHKGTVYTPELAERVYRIYRPDFEQFGYAKDSYVGL